MPDFGRPVDAPARVTQGWGAPRPNRNGVHEGFDFPVPVGSAVRSIGDGTVVVADNEGVRDPNTGKFLAVAHPGGWVSFYMHLDQLLRAKGDRVSKGALIARSGRTGIKSSGPHLHFHIKVDDPQKYVRLYGVPRTGLGRTDARGTTVPSEPLIPIDEYATSVKTRAAANGIPLHQPSGPGAFGMVLLAGVAYWAWRKLA